MRKSWVEKRNYVIMKNFKNKYVILLLCIVVTVLSSCGKMVAQKSEILSATLAPEVQIPENTTEILTEEPANSTAQLDVAGLPTYTPKVTPSPTSEPDNLLLSGLLIGIDAGHQGKGNNTQEPVSPGSSESKARVSSGTSGRFSGVAEHVVTLQVALLLEEKLTELGATVIMVRRTADVDISNSERATMMNDAGVDLCIRIHCDGNENSSISGTSMMVPSSKITEDINEASKVAGEIILDAFCKATSSDNRGLIYTSTLTGFNWSTVPVCLIEMGFMTNENDDYKLVSEEYQILCAEGIATGIVEWYELSK